MSQFAVLHRHKQCVKGRTEMLCHSKESAHRRYEPWSISREPFDTGKNVLVVAARRMLGRHGVPRQPTLTAKPAGIIILALHSSAQLCSANGSMRCKILMAAICALLSPVRKRSLAGLEHSSSESRN